MNIKPQWLNAGKIAVVCRFNLQIKMRSLRNDESAYLPPPRAWISNYHCTDTQSSPHNVHLHWVQKIKNEQRATQMYQMSQTKAFANPQRTTSVLQNKITN